MKSIYMFLGLFFINGLIKCQNSSTFQAGYSIRLSMVFSPKNKNEPLIAYRISASAGIADFWMKNVFYPSLNGELLLYNSGIGKAYQSNKKNQKPNLDFVLAFTLTSGYNVGDLNNRAFLRYFADFAMPSLKNPYLNSVSLGTNLIFTSDKNRVTQRVGFLNFNSNDFQISYYNDGTPFGVMFLGDGEDRYYTGGGVASIDKFNRSSNYFTTELSFHKFTGFTKSAFDFGNETAASIVEYGKDSNQINFNKSLLRYNFMFFKENQPSVGISVSLYNQSFTDVQHWIHNKLNYSYHKVVKPSYLFLEPIIQFNHEK